MRTLIKDLVCQSTGFISNENTFNIAQYSTLGSGKAPIRRHKHVENAKNVEKISLQDEVKLLEDHANMAPIF